MRSSLARSIWTGILAAVALLGQNEPPSGAEQDRILQAMHQYADQYVSSLPNFLCMQTTRQMEGGLRAKKLKPGDTLVYSLRFNEGGEKRTLERVNGKSVADAPKRWKAPLTSEGEFGILLSQVLGKESGASFTWSRWDSIGGKRLAVFDYEVDRAHSTLSLSLSDLAKAVLPYRGSVFGDPETGTVWRISNMVTEIPASLRTRQMGTTVDYSEVTISDKKYLLPSQAVISLSTDSEKIENDLAFTDYRKFSADAVIDFDAK